MAKFIVVLVMIMFIMTITGCGLVKSAKDQTLFSMIPEIKDQVEKNEWDAAVSDIHKFEEKYDKRKWKLQILGELDDYQSIELEIEKLKESAKEKDRLESNQGLSQIQFYMESIYSL
jgi:hypothetical protein